MKYNYKLLAASIPVILLIVSIIAFILNTRIAEGKPLIEELTPGVVATGETLEIRGKNFGNSRDNSSVTLSSVDLLSRYIIFWSDSLLKIKIPEKAGSGLISVETDRGISKPYVIVIEKNVPFISTGAYLPGLPFIETIDPPEGHTGSLLMIKGDNFGNIRYNSKLLFSSYFSKEVDTIDGETGLENFLEIPDEMIISWDNKEISFFLPENVQTGDVFIETVSGVSNAVFFEKSPDKDEISLQNKKTYMLNQTVNLSDPVFEGDSIINLWFISPVKSLNQRNIINLPDPSAISICPFPDMTLYKVDIHTIEEEFQLSQNTILDIYEQNNKVDKSVIIDKYDTSSPLFLKYTISSDLIPVGSARVKSVAASVTRRKKTNLDKAEALYDYVLARLTYSPEAKEKNPELVIDTQIGDSQAYSILFTALARNIGIPSRPVTGILVDNDKNVINHWWAEFYIEGYGWFPVDPALADEMEWETSRENPVEYYWGNIDNHHIAFSRGEQTIPKLYPDGIVYSGSGYNNLTHNIETDRKITQLRSTWSDVKITAIY